MGKVVRYERIWFGNTSVRVNTDNTLGISVREFPSRLFRKNKVLRKLPIFQNQIKAGKIKQKASHVLFAEHLMSFRVIKVKRFSDARLPVIL